MDPGLWVETLKTFYTLSGTASVEGRQLCVEQVGIIARWTVATNYEMNLGLAGVEQAIVRAGEMCVCLIHARDITFGQLGREVTNPVITNDQARAVQDGAFHRRVTQIRSRVSCDSDPSTCGKPSTNSSTGLTVTSAARTIRGSRGSPTSNLARGLTDQETLRRRPRSP